VREEISLRDSPTSATGQRWRAPPTTTARTPDRHRRTADSAGSSSGSGVRTSRRSRTPTRGSSAARPEELGEVGVEAGRVFNDTAGADVRQPARPVEVVMGPPAVEDLNAVVRVRRVRVEPDQE
jgi:hypothetical protein